MGSRFLGARAECCRVDVALLDWVCGQVGCEWTIVYEVSPTPRRTCWRLVQCWAAGLGVLCGWEWRRLESSSCVMSVAAVGVGMGGLLVVR